MSRKYQPDVKVFCVSSKLYSDHREDYKEQNAEYIRQSGIPELRRYCQSIAAEAQLRATSAFLNDRVPALLGSLNQWVLAASNSVTVERAATFRPVLDNARKILETVRIFQLFLHYQSSLWSLSSVWQGRQLLTMSCQRSETAYADSM
jgi:hypothetical protein